MTARSTARHVLVTGAAGGIGGEVCRAFAADGDQVTAVDVRADVLEGAVGATTAHALDGDLADADFAGTVVSTAWDAHGPVDVVIAAAGLYPATPFLDMSTRIWDRVHAVNVRAVMLMLRDLGRRCADTGHVASAVALTSGAANRARQGAAHYCTSKASLEMLIRAAALELGHLGIRVNGVSPGFVEVASDVNPVTEQYAQQVSANPLGRRGQPADVTGAVRWLVSPDAAWVTGSIVRVDGGASTGAGALPLHWDQSTGVQSGADDVSPSSPEEP